MTSEISSTLHSWRQVWVRDGEKRKNCHYIFYGVQWWKRFNSKCTKNSIRKNVTFCQHQRRYQSHQNLRIFHTSKILTWKISTCKISILKIFWVCQWTMSKNFLTDIMYIGSIWVFNFHTSQRHLKIPPNYANHTVKPNDSVTNGSKSSCQCVCACVCHCTTSRLCSK